MKWMLPIAIAGLAVASALSWTAAAAGPSEARIVYRTVRLSTPGRPTEVYSVLPSGGGRRLLARGADQPAWSPRRRRIAFAGTRVGQAGIWVMNADGTGRRRLTTRPGDGEPTWSPDGRRIAYRSSSATSFDLWVVPSTGGTRRPLLRTIWVLLSTGHARRVTRGGASFSPDWASDGRRIAFATGGRIAVVDTVARRQRILPSGSPRSADDPAWSPDGRRIAFQRGGQVLTMRAQDGGDRRYVTRASWGTNGEPDW